MCVTLGPAKLSKTLIYAGESRHPLDGRYIHVLAYQNRALNQAGRANAMVLPLPSKAAMSSSNAIGLSGYKDILKDLAKPIQSMSQVREARRSLTKSVEVFDVGSYSVVLASRAEDAVAAISQLPSDKQPQLNREIFTTYSKWYSGWPVAICCWNGKVEPEPLLWWYEPVDPRKLFFPMVDAHDGKAPNLGRDVRRDHTILVGSTIHPFGVDTKVEDLGPAAPYISKVLWGRVLEEQDFNRDYVVDVPFLRTLRNVQGQHDMHARLDPKIWNLDFEYSHPDR
jgi:hypothetical protein